VLGEGIYKVGYDIPAGEYNLIRNMGSSSAYYAVLSDDSGSISSIVTNSNFSGTNAIVTVSEGQYLKVSRAHFRLP
jgi:hypothetical protein